MTYLSDAEFKAYYKTDHWRRTRNAALARSGFRCAITGDDWRKRTKEGRVWRALRWLLRLLGWPVKEGNWLEVHHVQYRRDGQPVFYREKPEDLAVLWNRFHPRGRLSRRQIEAWRRNYEFRKKAVALVRWLLAQPQTLVRLIRRRNRRARDARAR